MSVKTTCVYAALPGSWLMIIVLILLLPAVPCAQGTGAQPEPVRELFTKIDADLQNLSQQARQRMQYLSARPVHKRVRTVLLPAQLHQEKILKIMVNPSTRELALTPGNGSRELHIIRDKITVLSDRQYAWSGGIYLPGSTEELGDATFIQDKEGAVTGTIDVEGVFFQVRSLGASGLHAVIELDAEERARRARAAIKHGDPKQSGPAALPAENQQARLTVTPVPDPEAEEVPVIARCQYDYIRALVLWTPGAALAGDLDGIIALAVQEANEAFDNSQVYYVNAAVAHQQQFNFNESNNIDFDLNRLIADGQVQLLRDQHDADVVILLTQANAYGNTLGVAGTIRLHADSAYAIVDVSAATGPDYTYAHEQGHLQAAQHHPDDPTDPNGLFNNYGFGHRFSYKASIFVPRRYRSTIMAFPCRPFNQDPFCDRFYETRKHFSNPNVEYRGADTGIAGERENWRVLRQTGNNVADFRDPNELRASITYSNSGRNYTFSDNSCGGTGGLSYEWRTSYEDPFTFGPVVSTGSSYSAELVPGTWYIRLTVNSSAGQTSNRVISVEVLDDSGGGGGTEPCQTPCDGPQPKITAPGARQMEELPENYTLQPAYPNPFNPSTRLRFTLPERTMVTVRVYDLAGREVAVLAGRSYAAGRHTLRFDAGGLSSGTYLVRLQAGGVVKTQRVTLIK